MVAVSMQSARYHSNFEQRSTRHHVPMLLRDNTPIRGFSQSTPSSTRTDADAIFNEIHVTIGCGWQLAALVYHVSR